MSNMKVEITLSNVRAGGSFLEKHFNLDQSEDDILIGRSSKRPSERTGPESAHAFFTCPIVSRRHARIFLIHGQVYIEDLGSLHGTKLNSEGEKLSRHQPRRLISGDIVVLGSTVNTGSIHQEAVVFQVGIKRFGPPNRCFIDLSSPEPETHPMDVARSMPSNKVQQATYAVPDNEESSSFSSSDECSESEEDDMDEASEPVHEHEQPLNSSVGTESLAQQCISPRIEHSEQTAHPASSQRDDQADKSISPSHHDSSSSECSVPSVPSLDNDDHGSSSSLFVETSDQHTRVEPSSSCSHVMDNSPTFDKHAHSHPKDMNDMNTLAYNYNGHVGEHAYPDLRPETSQLNEVSPEIRTHQLTSNDFLLAGRLCPSFLDPEFKSNHSQSDVVFPQPRAEYHAFFPVHGINSAPFQNAYQSAGASSLSQHMQPLCNLTTEGSPDLPAHNAPEQTEEFENEFIPCNNIDEQRSEKVAARHTQERSENPMDIRNIVEPVHEVTHMNGSLKRKRATFEADGNPATETPCSHSTMATAAASRSPLSANEHPPNKRLRLDTSIPASTSLVQMKSALRGVRSSTEAALVKRASGMGSFAMGAVTGGIAVLSALVLLPDSFFI